MYRTNKTPRGSEAWLLAFCARYRRAPLVRRSLGGALVRRSARPRCGRERSNWLPVPARCRWTEVALWPRARARRSIECLPCGLALVPARHGVWRPRTDRGDVRSCCVAAVEVAVRVPHRIVGVRMIAVRVHRPRHVVDSPGIVRPAGCIVHRTTIVTGHRPWGIALLEIAVRKGPPRIVAAVLRWGLHFAERVRRRVLARNHRNRGRFSSGRNVAGAPPFDCRHSSSGGAHFLRHGRANLCHCALRHHSARWRSQRVPRYFAGSPLTQRGPSVHLRCALELHAGRSAGRAVAAIGGRPPLFFASSCGLRAACWKCCCCACVTPTCRSLRYCWSRATDALPRRRDRRYSSRACCCSPPPSCCRRW